MPHQETTKPREPIAIVGMGCRLPGASGPAAFWQLLLAGGDAIREIPQDRLDIENLYHPTPATRGHIMTRSAGILDRLDEFDAQFFAIARREAELVDPQQRILLEVSWEALEDAGVAADRLNGTDAGVFVGLWLNEYENRMVRDTDQIDFYMTLGTGRYSASGRLSYFYGLQGPSITVDTACSSSLVAVHLACQSLWSGECNLALAGGANTILEPFITVAYSQSKMMAPDGRCKFGDARGDGYVRSDGAGVVVLKRLSDAEAAGDEVYAVIRGGAVNNDGRGSGFLATPAQDGQMDLLRKAYRHAGVSPGSAQYVEAHGTGTFAGDPVEIQALGTVLSEGRRAGSTCRLGSVKTNIGHTESAAGVAGLMKVALALKHGVIPRSLHFTEPNPRIPWSKLPVAVQAEASEWPEGREGAIAGVSAFGIAGTNAHLVLQAHTRPPRSARAGTRRGDRPQVLLLSAQTPAALTEAAKHWSEWLKAGDDAAFIDTCYTAAVRRVHHDHRLGIVALTRSEAAASLDAFVAGEARPGITSGVQKGGAGHQIVFIFPGQGSQWLGMGRALLDQEPAFAAALEKCDAAVQTLNGWSVIAELRAGASSSRLDQIDIVQPVLFSIQVALAAMWRSWGVAPDAVVGHSMGEIAAAHVAGALSLEDAARIICRRSALLRRTSGRGAMAVVELSLDDARTALAGREDRLSIAVSNSPRSTVVAGDPQALDELLASLEAREVFCRRIKVDVASHSPQMDPLRGDLFEALQGVSSQKASVAFYSTVEGAQISGDSLDASYWVRNLREPVLFAKVVQQLISAGHDTVIEMSSHPLLVGSVQEMLRDAGVDGLAIGSTRRDEDELSVIRASLATLHVTGAATLDWARHFDEARRVVATPAYPWQRERFWYDAPADTQTRGRADLFGSPLRPSLQASTAYFEFELSTERLPFLAEHRVRSSVIVPAAFFLEVAGEGARRVLDTPSVRFDRVAIGNALVLPAIGTRVVQLVISEGARACRFQLFSREPGEAGGRLGWIEHATGGVRAATGGPEEASHEPLASVEARCPTVFNADAHYAAMARRGLDYGPPFRLLEQARRGPGELLCRLRVPPTSTAPSDLLQLHTTLIDACLQTVVAALPVGDSGDTYVPVAIESAQFDPSIRSAQELWVHVAHGGAAVDETGDSFTADFRVGAASGESLGEVNGVRLHRIERERDARIRESLYRLDWQAHARDAASQVRPGPWLVLADDELGRVVGDLINTRGGRAVLVTPGRSFRALGPAHFEIDPSSRSDGVRLIEAEASCTGIVHLWSFGRDRSLMSEVPTTMSAANIVEALGSADLKAAPRVWLVTAGTQAANGATALAGSGLWGLRTVVAAEYPSLRCSAVDLKDFDDRASLESLVEELMADGAEDEIALRGEERLVRRLARGIQDADATPRPAADRPYRATTRSPGILDALHLEEMARREPSDDEVEIEVIACGLNFMNVLSALGMYPGYPLGLGPLGIECAGRVARVGSAVSNLREGDAVMAFAHHSLATHTVAHQALVRRIPTGLTFSAAATIPIAFLTAYYSLVHMGRLARGERVLIHSAAGGVGLAALQVARAAGAEVYATAGSEEKRALLRSLGVAHVSDSRSLKFVDDFQAATRGQGVDIVLNSLAGEAIDAGLSLLRSGGRFIEIGKRDIYENRTIGLLPFQRNLSYVAVDLDRMSRENPALLSSMLDQIWPKVADGTYKPLPAEVFPVDRLTDAFRRMAQGAHAGKIVIELDRREASVAPRRSAAPESWGQGTVLITGGTGGLGLAVARWMVDQGARHIVLVSRTGDNDAARSAIADLQARGASIRIVAGDVARPDDVLRIMAMIDRSMPPLCGVVHAAGLLEDATIAQLDAAQFERVAAPKIAGAWNLHEATAQRALDFFVLFSSVTSFIGSAGQASYSASNAVLDSLAAHRRARGLPAISIGWGPWSEVGLAAVSEQRGARLAEAGLGSLSPSLGTAIFGQLLRANPVHAAAMPFDVQRWCEAHPAFARRPLFADLLNESPRDPSTTPGRPSAGIRDALQSLPPGRPRRSLLESFIQQQAAHVLKLAPSRIERDKPLRTMGLDSLMGLELRNRLEEGTGATLPATLIWNYPTVALLAPAIAARMGMALEEAAAPVGPVTAPMADAPDRDAADVEALLEDIEDLSDEEARRLLAEEL